MGLRPQSGVFDLLQQAGKRLLAVDLGPQHLSVDEKADQPFSFKVPTARSGHTDIDRRLPAVSVQKALKAGQQQHEQRHVVLLRQLPQTCGQ